MQPGVQHIYLIGGVNQSFTIHIMNFKVEDVVDDLADALGIESSEEDDSSEEEGGDLGI